MTIPLDFQVSFTSNLGAMKLVYSPFGIIIVVFSVQKHQKNE